MIPLVIAAPLPIVRRLVQMVQTIRSARRASVKHHRSFCPRGARLSRLGTRQLLHRKGLHIITNAVNIGMELSSSNGLQTTLTGGIMRWAGAFSLVGPAAIEALSVVVMDRLFVGVTGMDAQHGATMIEPDEAAVFRAMARQARQIVVVADSSKMGHVSPAVVCPVSEIDLIITDDGIQEEAAKSFAARGLRVLVV